MVPSVHGFVWPRANGNCIPFLGVQIAGGLFNTAQAQGSAAYNTYVRVNQVVINGAALIGGTVTGTVVGIPTDAAARPLSALLYGLNDAGQVSGPLPGCAQSSSVPLVLQAGGGTGTFSIPCGAACATTARLIVVIAAATTPLCADDARCYGVCINNAPPLDGAALPPGVAGPSIAHVVFDRVPSASASPSALPSSSPEPEPLLPSPSPPATATKRIVTVTVTVTVPPSPNAGGFAIQDASGASSHVIEVCAALVAVVLAVAPYAM